METSRHEEVREIFLQAIQLSPEERPAFLEEKCRGDATLEQEVRTLLAFHDTRSLLPLPTNDTRVGAQDGTAEYGQKSPYRDLQLSRIYRQRRKWMTTIGLGAIALLGLLVWAQIGIRTSTRDVLDTQLRIILTQQAFMLRTWLADRTRDLQSWARTSGVQESIQTLTIESSNTSAITEAPELLRTELESLAGAAYPELRYAVWNRQRILIADASQNAELIGKPVSDAGAARLARVFRGESTVWLPNTRQSITEGFPVSELKDRPGIAFVVPVRDGETVIAALMVGGIGLQDRFEELLTKGRIGNAGETYAFDRDGYMISESRFGAQLAELGLIESESSQTAAIVRIADPGGDISRGYIPKTDRQSWPLTKMARSAIERLAVVTSPQTDNAPSELELIPDLGGYRDYRGVQVVGVWTWLHEYGFGLTTEINADQAYQTTSYLRSVMYGALVLTGVSMAATLVAGWWLARLRQSDQSAITVGPYRLGELLGEGGMGRVFKAEHELLKRPTAIKVIKSEVISASSERRFRREVQLASRLKSPHSIEIYDFGRSDTGFFYYAMEYLDGITVARMIGHGTVSPARTTFLLRQVCRSLEEAHGLGLVHRDIKPQNIMVCDRGGFADFVIVLDFGLAKLIDPHGTSATSTATVLGTPEYISPERIRDPQNVDPRGDLYAVGAVGYCMLTGGRLYDALSNLETLDLALHSEIEPIASRLGHSLHRDLESLIEACLSKDPAQRPASAKELRARLESLKFDEPWTESMARAWWNTFAAANQPTSG